MKRHEIEKKWWFVAPVIVATIASMYWMFSSLGIELRVLPFSFAKFLLWATTFFSFERCYSLVFRLILAGFTPVIGDQRKPPLNGA